MMEVKELLENEALRQREFPVVRDKIFLSHAGVAPLPRRVADAIREYANAAASGNQETAIPQSRHAETRELAAGFVGADPTEIAFVGPTSLALSYIASGIRFREGDEVLVYFEDYPSNVYPWAALEEHGVNVRYLKAPPLGEIRLEDIQCQVGHQTRLVALASCHFISGWRPDISAIGQFLHEQNILFSVDGIQTVGAFPTSVAHVDFLAADSHKWMLGPCGAGMLYVRRSLQEQFQPPIYGWRNIRSPDFVTQEQRIFREGAQRYEVGTYNLLGQVGFHAALELLRELGIEAIANELQRKRAWLVPALEEKGYTVVQAGAPAAHTSGIVSFYRDDTDLGALYDRLEKANIFTSLRVDIRGKRYIRISPHVYTTDSELKTLLSQL